MARNNGNKPPVPPAPEPAAAAARTFTRTPAEISLAVPLLRDSSQRPVQNARGIEVQCSAEELTALRDLQNSLIEQGVLVGYQSQSWTAPVKWLLRRLAEASAAAAVKA